MRILYSHRIQSRDGQGVHLDSLVAALRAEGHEVRVVGPAAYDQAELGGESRLVALIRRRLPRFAVELLELAYSAPAFLKLDRAAREFTPDLLYERYNLFYLAGALVARRRRLAFLVEVNAPLAEERARFGGLALKGLARWSERFVWRRADRVLPVTAVLGGHVAAAGVPAERIVVIPNGIDLADFPEALAARQSGPEAASSASCATGTGSTPWCAASLAGTGRRGSGSAWWARGRRGRAWNASPPSSASPRGWSSRGSPSATRSRVSSPGSTSRCSRPWCPMPRP